MTKKKSPILVSVDFSPHSRAALEFAAGLAQAQNAPLVVLHVVHDPGEAPGYYAVKGRKKQMRRLEDVAEEMLAEFLRDARKESSMRAALEHAESMLVAGLPVNRILETADKVGASMIVMGSQGRTGLSHLMLGSKAEQVVRLAPIPVTIVKAVKHKK